MRRVVVTGMGAITPVGNDIETFWANITQGKCGIDFITKFDASDFKVKVAAEVNDFHPENYMEKSDIRRTDLYTQYAIAASSQAMKDSDLQGNIENDRLGVYIGSGIGGINTFYTETEKMIMKGHTRISPFFIPMMIANIAAGNVAIRFHAQGPCLPVVTACATSTHAIGEAFRAIKHGYADAIIAGGAEASITPLSIAGFTSCMALSTRNEPLSSSIPFDKRRDGFVMGEGAGIMILEEYEHAVARNAKIYAEICGYGNTCDAYHITAPNPEGLASGKAITLALSEADVNNDHTVYINAHGTSTPLNDKVETLAIKNAFGARASDVLISSTKSMTGHMLGAAGAAEAIVSVLTIVNGIVPPTIGYEVEDPDCDLDYVPNIARKAEIDVALSTSLGFGGHNACIAFKRIER